MSDLVPTEDIERIVGIERHSTEHYGRASSDDQTVYILHSKLCLDSGLDLRFCAYSTALDKGIIDPALWNTWHRVQDRPVRLALWRGFLLPHESELTPAPPVTVPEPEGGNEG